MKTEHLQIKFEGQQCQIDANTLVNTLIHYSALITEINKIYGDGERNVNIKVNAIEKGSFIIDISLMESLREVIIFSKENLEYVYYLTGILTTAFGIYKYKKGKPVSNGDEEKINNIITQNNINIDNKTIVNIYNNTVVRESISKSIETADEDEAIEGIIISTKIKKGKNKEENNNQVQIEKDEFAELIYDEFDKEVQDIDKNIIHDVVENAILSIMVVSFDSKTKWKFIYNGIKLPAMDMKDAGLKKDIDNGMPFSKGDAIRVKLEITKEFNPSYNAYENKKYRILEVLEHIKRPQQSSLF